MKTIVQLKDFHSQKYNSVIVKILVISSFVKKLIEFVRLFKTELFSSMKHILKGSASKVKQN